MRKLLLLTVTLLSFGLQAQTWTARTGVSMATQVPGFYEFLPSSYNGTDSLPCIIFMHGLGKVGNGDASGLANLITEGLPLEITNNISAFNAKGAVIICPQLNITYPAWFVVENIINYVRNNYVVKRSRIYLTGLSMGGGAILDWTEGGTIEKIAAIAALCPTSVYQSAFGDRLKAAGMPVYLFHGDADGTVSFSASTGWLTGLNGGTPIVPAAKMDTIFGGGHNIWSTVYPLSYTTTKFAGPLVDWLLAQDRNPPIVVTMLYSIRSKIAGVYWRMRMYSDGTWTREQFISGAWQIVNY
jgi:predicted esterase